METDRGAILTQRAAARGVVDFSKARLLDVRWWRRVNALIETMAADDNMIAVRAAFDLQRSLVGNSGLTEKSFEACQKASKALFGDIIDVANPWEKKAGAGKKVSELNNLISDYKKYVGDPNDPEYAKKLLHDLDLIDSAAAEEPEETENTRIDRLLREREEHYAEARRGGRR